MKGAWVLLAYSLRRVRILLIAMGALLAGFQVLLIGYAGSIQRSGTFEQMGALMPSFVREMMGPSFPSFMSFSGIVCLGYFHPVVMISLAALSIALGTMPVSEIETGFMDLILARPLARHWIITRSIIVGTISIAGLLILMVAGTWVGLKLLAPKGVAWPAPDLVFKLAANLALLLVCWLGIALAISSLSIRRSAAGTVAGLIALAAFLLDYLGRAWQPLQSVAWLSPFRYYSPFDMLMGNSVPEKNPLVLAGIAILGFMLAYIFFLRRDITH
jgi:ABC-2 type transport system permease protein